jgi:hypothetical protein
LTSTQSRAKRGIISVHPPERGWTGDASLTYSSAAVQVWFARLYGALGFDGASSHSGRRTFITKAAKRIVEAGGTFRNSPVTAASPRRSGTFRGSRAKQNVVRMI